MAILWNPTFVSFDDVVRGKQFINGVVTCFTSQSKFKSSFVYGLYSVPDRRKMFEEVARFGNGSNLPWCVLGDFNCVASPSEQLGVTLTDAYRMTDLVNFKVDNGLEDAPWKGQFLTWYAGSKLKKLDRVMINKDWNSFGISWEAHFLDMRYDSDHCPVIFSSMQQRSVGRKPFKFYNMWLKHDSIKELVRNGWAQEIEGTAQFSLVTKLKALKKPLRELNSTEFGGISERVKKAKADFDDAYARLLLDPANDSLVDEVTVCRKSANILRDAEKSFYMQKAKVIHLCESDQPTKFFHSIANSKRRQTAVPRLLLSNGTFTTSHDEVVQCLVDYYTDLLGGISDCSPVDGSILQLGPVLSGDMVGDLTLPISCEEIKEALWSIHVDKAPGPDGFSSGFFKHNWSIVGGDFIAAVQEFFTSGQLLKQLNHTIIALIKKTDSDPKVGDFRPISCTNVIYKVITKILSARMAPLLGFLVDHAQSAFVPGRSMNDNIFLAQELVRGYARKQISPRFMLKLDIRKAFDSLSWGFLRDVLLGLGFPPGFVGWIMECVTTTSFSISLNGKLHGFFKGKRGLRQGDPMSPALFVLAMEYFSRLLKAKARIDTFKFHPKCKQLGITHLTFADDLMLFCRGDFPSIRVVMDAIEEMGDVSGLRVNNEKSHFFAAGLGIADLDRIASILQMPPGNFPVRYLGIPLSPLKVSCYDFAPLLSRVENYLQAWNTKTLSYAGRLELIRSVIQGVESFWLQAFPVQNTILDRIVQLCRSFLWSGKYAKVAWADICAPRNEGGLGIKDGKVWNSALLAKVLWNVHTKADSLWVKWVNTVYLRNRNVWTWSPRTRDSPLLKKLALIRDKLVDLFGSEGDTVEQLQEWSEGGKLSSSKVYDALRVHLPHRPWMSLIWKKYIPPKFSFITWLAFRDRLPTLDRLTFLDVPRQCALCKAAEESVAHLFFQCSFSSGVWNAVRVWLGETSLMSSLRRSVRVLQAKYKGATMKDKAIIIALPCVIYHVWRARNDCTLDTISPKTIDIITKVKVTIYRVLGRIYPVEMVRKFVG